MGELQHFISPYHTQTQRDYLARMQDDKVNCMKIARQFEQDYWDGDRRYGYGGYNYDGRWANCAKKLIEHYQIAKDGKVLDIGCGKAFILHEIKELLPKVTVCGIDISQHALNTAPESLRKDLIYQKAEEKLPFEDNAFDFAFSIMALHNLLIHDLKTALQEMQRCAKKSLLVVESYRNEEELFNLQCWALTCESWFKPEEWKFLFSEYAFEGDYEFLYFE